MAKPIAYAAATLPILLLSKLTYADQLYVGAALGKTTYKDAEHYAIASDSTAYEFFVGARLQDAFGLEISYLNLGDVQDYYLDSHINISGFSFSGKAILPMGPQAELFAKAGLFSWTMDEVYYDRAYYMDEGADLIYGGGVSLQLTRQLNVHLEYRALGIHDMDASLVNAGINLVF